MTASVAPGLLVAGLLALVRAASWLAFAPPFNSPAIPARVKIGLAGGLAIAVAPHISPAVGASALPVSTAAFVGAVVLQALTGVALGYLTGLLFSAVSAAGSLLDLVAGLNLTAAVDPLGLEQQPVLGRSFNLIALTLLFALDAHLMLVKGFLTSFQAVPLSGPSLAVLQRTVVADVGLFFLSAVEIAAPLGAVLFLTDVALGLLSRAAPQLNVFNLGFAVKVLLVLLLVGTTLPLLPGAVGTLVDHSIRDGLGLLGIRA